MSRVSHVESTLTVRCWHIISSASLVGGNGTLRVAAREVLVSREMLIPHPFDQAQETGYNFVLGAQHLKHV
jgi:hypothetical protein